MNRFLALVSIIVPVVAAPAAADTAMECAVQTSSQVEVASCVAAQARIVDQVLDQALGFARDAAAELDGVTGRDVALPALDEAQTAWLAYRDAQCSYSAALFGGGPGAGIAESACHVALTCERIAQLMASLP